MTALFTSFNHFRLVLAAVILWLGAGSAIAQAQKPVAWNHLRIAPAERAGQARLVDPLRGEMFRLDNPALQKQLASAPKAEPWAATSVGTDFHLPMPDGTIAHFKVVEYSIMEPGLAAQFPEIKTYAGQGIDDPSATVRLDFSPSGFHAQVLSPSGAVYVDPAYRGDVSHYVSYFARDNLRSFDYLDCQGERNAKRVSDQIGGGSGQTDSLMKTQSGTTLRTFRLAIACTGEYATNFGGTVSGAMNSGIVPAVNRINGIFETELAVRLVLIANNSLVVYTNPATDPFSNADLNMLLVENQTTLSNVIGVANFDVGHVLGAQTSGGSGLASLGCVCSAAYKGQGASKHSALTSDSFWVSILAHEMGHQFGANHSFNAESGSCAGNRNAATAYEPGSGSTIMSYASACNSTNNLQSPKDVYFHGGNLDEIQTFLSGGGSGCALTSATGNNPPTVSVGPNCTIPISTPFALTATASDPNGDSLTYCWEELDLGPASNLIDPDNGSSPLFRSMPPTNNATRYFPKLTSVLANTNWNQEKLPTTSRTMKFRVTARDNRSGGGGVADADIQITSVSSAGPFVVTSPNTAVAWSGQRTVTWNVAGTSSAPISTTGVDIWLSTNSGSVFNILLGTNVANTGSATVILPNLTTSTARIKVAASGNVYYDVSDINFSISPGMAQPLVQLGGVGVAAESCQPANGALDPYEPVTLDWTLVNVGSGPTTNLVATMLATNGIYLPSNGVYVSAMTQNYGVIPAGGSVTRQFGVTPVANCGGSVTSVVQMADGGANMGTNIRPLSLGAVQTVVSTQVFNVASSITIPTLGKATPYPSSNVVSVSGTIIKVYCTLNGFIHTFPNDVDVMLVGPGGQTVLLMGHCGGVTNPAGANITIDDNAASSLPFNEKILTGTYKATDYGFFNLPSPAPAGPYGTTLAPLLASPNGVWKLYVADAADPDGGSFSGWSLSFVTSGPVTNCCNTFPAPTLSSTTYSNNAIQFGWNSLPGPHYQVQFKTNLGGGTWSNLGSSILGTNTFMTIADPISNRPVRFYRVLVGP